MTDRATPEALHGVGDAPVRSDGGAGPEPCSATDGWVAPVPVFTRSEARRLGWELAGHRNWQRARSKVLEPRFEKEAATWSPWLYRLATRPDLVELARSHIGADVVLWSAVLAVRRPHQQHSWHTDIEASNAVPSSTVNVWIPLHGGGPRPSLLLVEGSQHCAVTAQQAIAEAGYLRDTIDEASMTDLARRHGADGRIARVAASPGEAVVFDGRLWHASQNLTSRTRRALLLQYARPDTHLRVPEADAYDWPFTEQPRRMRCVIASGSDESGANEVVEPPGRRRRRALLDAQIEPLGTHIEQLGADRHSHGSRDLFGGPTATGLDVRWHVSRLEQGHTPHRPHLHADEEVLIVLRGALDVTLSTGPRTAERVERLGAGGVLHYPLDQYHTVTGASDDPAIYVMAKWKSDRITRRSDVVTATLSERSDPVATDPRHALDIVIGGPTRYLRRLQVHRSTMPVGAGYAAHADAYDVALVTFDGVIETLDTQVGPDTLVWYPMGSRHGLRNAGAIDAHYVAIEFHGANLGSLLNPHRAHHAVRGALRFPFRVVRGLARRAAARNPRNRPG